MFTCRQGEPSGPLRGFAVTLSILAGAAAASACASTDDGPLLATAPSAEITVVSTTVAAPEPSQVAEAPEPDDPLDATVEIDGVRYEFTVTCVEQGAGEVLVVGTGTDPISGGEVELYLQAFLRDPYIALRHADGRLIEPALESMLDLYVQDDVIRASSIRFVSDLDLATGEAIEMGFGSVEVHCRSYDNELPSG